MKKIFLVSVLFLMACHKPKTNYIYEVTGKSFNINFERCDYKPGIDSGVKQWTYIFNDGNPKRELYLSATVTSEEDSVTVRIIQDGIVIGKETAKGKYQTAIVRRFNH